jgi:hypothetical protein
MNQSIPEKENVLANDRMGMLSVGVALGGIGFLALWMLLASLLHINLSGLVWFVLLSLELAAFVLGVSAFRSRWGKCGVWTASIVMGLLILFTR